MSTGVRKLNLAVLISGRGSNMANLLKACDDPQYPARPVLVLSNRPDAAGIPHAAQQGVATAIVDHRAFGKDREAFEREIDRHLRAVGTDVIALAGFMRVLTPWFVARWAGRLVNIHPSLLPKYKGLDTHQRAIDAGDAEAGCTVHFVSDGVDEGAIIAQSRVPVLPGDTPVALAARVIKAEQELYPRALGEVCHRLLLSSH